MSRALKILCFILVFSTPAYADWVFVVEGKERHTYPDESPGACPLDKANWKWVHPTDRTECRKIKGKRR